MADEYKVEMWSINKVVPYAGNPRKHEGFSIPKVAQSIHQFDFRQPIVVDRDGIVIVGHGRLEAAKSLNLLEVPVHIASDLSEAQTKAYRIADNKTAEYSDWDDGLLFDELLDLQDMDFDLETTGFDGDEVAAFLAANEAIVDELNIEKEILDEIKGLDDLVPTKEEWLELNGKIPIIEFSGGKDSSATVVWALHFLQVKPILVYCSIGADHPSLWQHLFDCAKFFECEFKILNSPISFFDVLAEKGWPGFKFPWCIDLMHKITDKFVLKNYDPDSFIVLRGGRNQEKIKRDNVKKERLFTISRVPWKFFQPFAFCSKKVCEEVLFSSDVPLWSGYNYGLDRTACWICPGQRTTTYAALRRNYPDLWESLLKWESQLGQGAWQNAVAFNVLADKGAAKLNKSCCLKRSVKRIF